MSAQRRAIERLLRAYHVPRTDLGPALELPAPLRVRTDIASKEPLHADQ